MSELLPVIDRITLLGAGKSNCLAAPPPQAMRNKLPLQACETKAVDHLLLFRLSSLGSVFLYPGT